MDNTIRGPELESLILFGSEFYRYGTGGGHEGLRCDMPDGRYILVTDNDGGLPTARDWVMAIHPDENGEDWSGDCVLLGTNAADAFYL